MSGNICRCGAYPNIVAAIHDGGAGRRPADAALRLRRAADRVRAAAARGGRARRRFIAGGTDAGRLMKLGVERASALVDINALPLARIEALPATACASARWRA